MAEYKITKVSEQEPRLVHNDQYNSDTYYIKVALDGHDRPVEIGKKKPDALKVGYTVNGTIISKPDFPTDSFKADPAPFGGHASGFQKPIRDDSHIRAQWAIGQAMTHFAHKEEVGLDKVEKLAGALFEMVDRVKTVQQAPVEKAEPKGKYDDDIAFVKELGEELNDIEDRPIELSEIPF